MHENRVLGFSSCSSFSKKVDFLFKLFTEREDLAELSRLLRHDVQPFAVFRDPRLHCPGLNPRPYPSHPPHRHGLGVHQRKVRVCEAFLEGQCRRFHCQDLHELPGMCRKNALFLNTPFDCNRGRWCDHSHEPMSEQEKELFMITERDKILHYVRKGWIQLSRPNAHWATPFIRKHFNIKNVIPRQQSQQGQKSKEAAGMLHAAQVGGAGGEGAPSDVCASEKGGAAAMQEGVGRVGVPGEKGGAAAMQEGVGRVGVPGEKGGAAAMQEGVGRVGVPGEKGGAAAMQEG
eukprot:Cvel_34395.t1-p1 / transcript=Cvel_34395.t1 / gene=Cvel_34395 / organism=Chromera_velia_CCMP2878 / gene_product=hypothetical protein / transcript_product=hypothetical protein / location=Cvel_scaffold5895:1-1379(-) / protein_length=288 / sequence_SO=supercontig / SO=protein_coding / is_pseudo=false